MRGSDLRNLGFAACVLLAFAPFMASAAPITVTTTFQVLHIGPVADLPGLAGSTWTFEQVYPDGTTFVADGTGRFAGGAATTLSITGSTGGLQDGTYNNITGTTGIDIFAGFEGLTIDNLVSFNFPAFNIPSGHQLDVAMSHNPPAVLPGVGDPLEISDFGVGLTAFSNLSITVETSPGFFELIGYDFVGGSNSVTPVVTSGPGPGPGPGPDSTIPEPTTLVLMGLGLAGIGFRRRQLNKV